MNDTPGCARVVTWVSWIGATTLGPGCEVKFCEVKVKVFSIIWPFKKVE